MATTQVKELSKVERRCREYETIYILRSSVSAEEAQRIATRVREIIEGRAGTLLKVDNWGRRKLAYPIEKASRGVFVFLSYVGFEDLVQELERNLRLLDPVIRYQTILVQSSVDPASYQIDAEDLVFRPLEEDSGEEEPGLAARLGLVDRPRRSDGDGDSDYDGDGYGGNGGGNNAGDDDDDVVPGSKASAAADASKSDAPAAKASAEGEAAKDSASEEAE